MPHDPTPATDRPRDLPRRAPRSRTNPPDPGHHAILPTRISAFTAHQPHASSQVSAICYPKTCSSDPSQVLDGELVVLGADGRLSFDALQQRLVTSPAKARS